ncbi:MAG: type II toxin-antitoxin system PemK/MazF family toxin [Patescibacteria group bacterium]|mgnify:CR=1 FL=1
MTRYKRWDVLVTAFPFADELRSKMRPAVCVAAFNPADDIELYWLLMITSTHLKGWKGDVDIDDVQKAGLPIPSIVRTSKIACVDASFVEKKAGVLDTRTKDAIRTMLQKYFA